MIINNYKYKYIYRKYNNQKIKLIKNLRIIKNYSKKLINYRNSLYNKILLKKIISNYKIFNFYYLNKKI